MERRILGKTGTEVTILGLGGFHMLEIGKDDVAAIANRYLDAGGNYVETAASYGNGESERKLGPIIGARRDELFLTTKIGPRDKATAAKLIERSLRNLQTDHLDLVLLHGVQTLADIEQADSEDGSLRAMEAARKVGKVRFIGLSGHGQPDALIGAIQRYPFDVVMTGFNYYDRFNFLETERSLLPMALRKKMGVIGMKAIADGYLYRSAREALRYAWSLPISLMVAGINTLGMLENDLRWAEEFAPMSEGEKEELYHTAPELGEYVCRQCAECLPASGGLNIPRIFMLEGWYDRQMWDGIVRDAADYALRNRLRFWFNQQRKAQELYALEPVKVDPSANLEEDVKCPYGIPIRHKLRIAHYKLSGGKDLF